MMSRSRRILNALFCCFVLLVKVVPTISMATADGIGCLPVAPVRVMAGCCSAGQVMSCCAGKGDQLTIAQVGAKQCPCTVESVPHQDLVSSNQALMVGWLAAIAAAPRIEFLTPLRRSGAVAIFAPSRPPPWLAFETNSSRAPPIA